jgi:hypothetical protein
MKYSKKLFWLIPIIGLFLFIGCGENYQYEKAKKINTIEAYKSFIKKYPTSEFVELAEYSIDSLRYSEVALIDSLEGLKVFIEKYPDSRFYSKALDKIEEITFNTAKKKKSINALKAYLRKYPSGKFSTKAEGEIKHILKAHEDKWLVEIFETMMVDSIDRYGGPDKHASDRHKLLILGMEVKPPKEGDGLKFNSIRASSGSSKDYPLLAVDCEREVEINGDWYNWHMFLLLEDAKEPQKTYNRMFFMNQDKWCYLFSEGILEGVGYIEDNEFAVAVFESEITFQREKLTKVYFLFEVPVTTKRLHLQLGKNLRFPIPFAQ